MELVRVTWVDSKNAIVGWEYLEDANINLVTVESVGYVIKDDESILAIAQSVSEGGNKTPAQIEQVMNVVAIPKVAITSCVSLCQEPELEQKPQQI